VQAFQAAEEQQHPQQEEAEAHQQARQVGKVDQQHRREPGAVDPERGKRQPPDLAKAQAEVLGKGGQREGSPAQPIQT
jgi:hypothetical protein